ncbi:MAG: hypothetical protein ACTSQE_06520 [Candidatus Heimdallarchaeaceae archaeon]
MFAFSQSERIRLFAPAYKFVNLISKEKEQELYIDKYEQIIIDPPNETNREYWLNKISDPIERFIIIALAAKQIAEERKIDDRNILFALSKVPYYFFPKFSEENISLYSQADLPEVISFLENYKNNLLLYSPRYDTKLTILLKIEFYINSLLYFGLCMNEKRLPYGDKYYSFLTFMMSEIFSILKPLEEEQHKEIIKICSAFSIFLTFNSVIYLFDHYPEQAVHLIFILKYTKNFDLTTSEKEILKDYLKAAIFINNEDKAAILLKIES